MADGGPTTGTVRDFPLPDLGEGLTEGEILRWLVAEGDLVTQNQPIVEVETAKAAVEIPAKWPGTIVRIHHQEGATVAVGALLVSIDTDAGGAGGSGQPAEPNGQAGGRTAVLVGYGPRTGPAKRRPRKTTAPPQEQASAAPAQEQASAAPPPEQASAAPAQEQASAAPPPEQASAAPPQEQASAAPPRSPAPVAVPPPVRPPVPLAKPPVRKLARDLGVDLHAVAGTGPAGSITREDVRAALTTATPAVAPAAGGEQRIPVRGVRKLTAENVTASAFTAPHVTEFLTVDVTRSVRALARLRKQPEWREVRVSPLLLAARAVLVAIRRHPMINSSWDGASGEIVVKDYVNLGIAAATERGLIVPNIKDAGRLSLRELSGALAALVDTARAGKTTPADMTGGTFTITNVGVFGVDTGTPILPPGEAAILALGAVREAPWVHKGKVRPRHVTTLGLSFDHRIVDGELGSRFLADVGAFLADPETALLAWT